MPRRLALAASLGALLVPTAAGPAQARAQRAAKLPVVTSVAPMKVTVGATLTLRGRNFLRGRGKDTVVFKRDGHQAVFAKAGLATAKLMKVTVPAKLADALLVRDGASVPTRFQVRVLAHKLGRAYTPLKRSPLVAPVAPPAPPTPPPAAPDQDCDGDGATNRVDADDDNDLLADALEIDVKLDPCRRDTDGDGVEDGFEYRSAMDLNDDEHQEPNTFLPYPGKRPYPNPLDGTDAGTDYDGDDLTLGEESVLWQLTVAHGAPRRLDALTYSDGEQYSASVRRADGRRTPTLAAGAGYDKQQDFERWAASAGYATVMLAPPGGDWYDTRSPFSIYDDNRDGVVSPGARLGYDRPETAYADTNGNGWLSDDERDEDADGLTNFEETSGCMNRAYWGGLYNKETPYYLNYAGTRLDDPDSDGDGIRDGADDQDHDDVPNMMECSRNLASGQRDPRPSSDTHPSHPDIAFVNPFNPCLPSTTSRTCKRIIPFEGAWAPFNPDKDVYFYVWN
jgi:hypothetical protein